MAAPLTVPVLLGLALHRSARRVTSRASGRSGRRVLRSQTMPSIPSCKRARTRLRRRKATTPQARPTGELFSQRFLMRPFAGRDALRDDASIPSLQARQNTADPISRAQRVAFAGE